MVPQMFPASPSRTPRPLDRHRHPGPPAQPGRIGTTVPMLRVLAIAVILGAAGLAATPAPAMAQGLEGTVTGTVKDSDGKALSDAVVEFRRSVTGDIHEYHRTTSGPDGTYSVSGLDAGTWHVSARLDGHRTNESTFSLSAGQSRTIHIELLSMFESYYIATILSAENATPIAGAVATVTNYDHESGQRTATSDANGQLRLRLFANENQVSIVRSGYQTYQDWVWSPRGDIERTIHMHTAPEQTVTIIGKVINGETNEPVKSWIDLYPDWNAQDHPKPEPRPMPATDGGGSSGSSGGADADEPASTIAPGEPYPYYPQHNNHNNTITADDGTFTMKAYPGSVILSANRRGYLVEEVRTTLTDGQTWNIEIVLSPLPDRTVTIAGTVTDASTGKPLQGASVNVEVPGAGDYQWAQTDADGKYSVKVRPGHTIVEVRYWGYHAYDMVASDGGDAMSSPVPPGGQGREYHPQVQTLTTEANGNRNLSHALSQRPGPTSTLVGYVVDTETQKGIPDARVSIENHDSRDWGSATTDANGSYKFELYGGYHTISVHVDGYLPTRSNVNVPDSGTARQDLMIQAGSRANEGWWDPDGHREECCIAYGEDGAKEGTYGGGNTAPAAAPSRDGLATDSDESSQSSSARSGGSLRGSGGGLPAYDPSAKGDTFENRESASPAAFVLVMAIGLLAVVVGLRRRD